MIVTVVGTLGSFAVMILNQQASAKATAAYQKAQAQYTAVQKTYQAEVDAQTSELSKTYYNTFVQYKSQVGKFDINSVKSLSTEDLVTGSGDTITSTSQFAVYYIGWDATGNIFDESIDTSSNSLKAPYSLSSGLGDASVIDGWKTGLVGMKVGGVRLLTIPSDKAYGASGQTDSSTGKQTIAPNMPLKFAVMAIPMPATVAHADAYSKATQAYYQAYQTYSNQ